MTAPDLRTAASDVLDALTTSDPAIGEQLDVRADRLREALAAEATEPPPEPTSVLADLARCTPVTTWSDSPTSGLNGRWWCLVCGQIAPAGADKRDEDWHPVSCPWVRARRLRAGSAPNPQGADEPPRLERAYWELVEAATQVVGAYDDPDDESTDDVYGAIEVLREHIPDTPRRERLARLRDLRSAAVGAPDEPGDDDPCRGFVWIGQPMTSCDRCERPAWEHEGLDTPPDDPFSDAPSTVRPWGPEEAEAIRRKWGNLL